MYSVFKPNKLKYLYLVTFEFNEAESSPVRTVYESDHCYSDFLKIDLRVIRDSVNMARADSVKSVSVIDLDNNLLNAY